MRPKPPVLVAGLFAEERRLLLDILRGLSRSEWGAPTSCPGWSVKDIAAHVLGDDLNNLSGGRDGFSAGRFDAPDWDALVTYVNERNEAWVDALRRLSPRVLVELLEFIGEGTATYYSSLDLTAPGPNVAWAGQGHHPMWLHVAREYTERWLHQMQVREATGAPGLYERRLFHPVLDTFVHALPVAYSDIEAAAGALVRVVIDGEGGGEWSLVRTGKEWDLVVDPEGGPAATARVDEVTAWKLWTKGLLSEEARSRVQFEGEQRLGEPLLQAVAIVA